MEPVPVVPEVPETFLLSLPESWPKTDILSGARRAKSGGFPPFLGMCLAMGSTMDSVRAWEDAYRAHDAGRPFGSQNV